MCGNIFTYLVSCVHIPQYLRTKLECRNAVSLTVVHFNVSEVNWYFDTHTCAPTCTQALYHHLLNVFSHA